MIHSIEEHDPVIEESSVGEEGQIKKKDICEVAVAAGEETEWCTPKDWASWEGVIWVCRFIGREEKIGDYSLIEENEKI